MRIAFVLPVLSVSGGVGVVLDYARYLASRGCHVDIFNESDKPYDGWNGDPGCRIFENPGDYEAINRLYDVGIASFWTTVKALTSRRLPAKLKFQLIQGLEEDFYDPADLASRSAVLEALRQKTTKIAISSFLRRQLRERYGLPSYLMVNGINLDIFRSVKPLMPKGPRLRILVEGNHENKLKRVDEMCALLEQVRALGVLDFEYWVVSNGLGPAPSHWRSHLFLRNVPKQAMPKVYSSVDVVLKLSHTEGFGLAPLEAMACGVVPIVNDFGGQADYLKHGRNGFLLDPVEPSALLACLQLLADPAARQTMQAQGLDTAQQFSFQQSARRFHGLLHRLVSGSSRRPGQG